MPGNSRMRRNCVVSDSYNPAPGQVEADMMSRLKLGNSEDNGGVGDEAGAYPDRPGEPDCLYYLRTGTCGYGSNCRFNHPSNGGHDYGVRNTTELPERAGQPDCEYYLKTGWCKYGSTCKYHHPKDRSVDSSAVPNILGLPMREDAKPCLYYMRTGLCKYGYACKFHHPQPLPTANVLPVVGPSVVSSSGAPSVGELPTASLPKATYFPSPSMQLPQSYMSLFLSPSQGWSTYMGSFSPLSMTTVHSAPASNGKLSASYLPERPDQPECRYFMNYGSCKYGQDCKYHHPREKISQLTSSSLGPLGLPLRPGDPVCSYYSLYGLCKYGPTCKFDHPLDAYSYAYSLSIPSLAALYSPPIPYQRASPQAPSSEISPSKSSTLSEGIKQGATGSDENWQASTKGREGSPDQSDSLPNSFKTPYELIHYESSKSL
ncbi:zinc finger CCCH domain-containing protein 3-like isoform X1 [Primulina huaijiensis]|uniref:zinc finger CCCH domain-containing protein 3-like isoform X1 n=1 Tax=Primulina huaijiensis TaxID=1492673 RepID=UPI003CC6F6B6